MKMMLQRIVVQAKKHRVAVGAAAALLVGVVWYVFRPELLFVNATVHEGFPAIPAGASENGVEQIVLLTGSFHSVAHDSKGTATIHQLANGNRVLRLTEFATSNGPAVRVLLVGAADATDSSAVKQASSIDLGALKGNIGDQNYDVPAGVDLGKYRSVTIWCERFSVNFATAPLVSRDKVTATAL